MTTTGAIKYDYEQKREENELKNIEEILRDDLGKVSGALEFRNLTWSNQKASVKIVKLQENEYKIEYKIENKDKQIIKDWTEIENGGEIGSLELGDTVYARLTNETTLGVKYSKDTASITINDTTPPSAPTLSITSGTPGNNGTYKSAVTVTVTPGIDGQSGVLKTTYVITGSQTIGETEGTSINITAEGTSYITAYTYDKANNKTASQELTVNIKYNTAPVVETPTGTAKANTNNTIIVTAKATDEDENTTLTYTLWWGTSSGNLSATNITKTGTSGQAVTLEKSELSNDTTYYFKVVVSDGTDSATSGQNSAKTYCLGTYCSGGTYAQITCTSCGGTGKGQAITQKCTACNGQRWEGLSEVLL